MDTSNDLGKLPLIPLLQTLQYLDLSDYLNVSQTCKAWNDALQEQSLWRETCLKMQIEIPAGTHDYKQILVDWSTRFAGFRAYYPRMRSLYLRFIEALRTCAPPLLKAFGEPPSRAEFDEICGATKKRLKCDPKVEHLLPEEVGCWYLITDFADEGSPPLFGLLQCYNITLGGVGMPLREALSREWTRSTEEGVRLVPPYVRLAIEDSRTAKRGNLIMPYPASKDCFVVADGWANYLENYIMLLEQGILTSRNRTEVSKWPVLGIPEETTRETKVTAAHIHHPLTTHPQWLFMYHITISMPSTAAAGTSKLRTRHWEITDLDGHSEIVDGPGVVGEFPEIGPGDSFSYASCSYQRTPGGHMQGYFTMQNLLTGEEWNLQVPRMDFRVQKTITHHTLAANDLQTS